MFNQKRQLHCVSVLSVSLLFAVPAWTQITTSNDAYTSSPGSTHSGSGGGLDPQGVAQAPQGQTGTSGAGSNHLYVFETISSDAVHDVGLHDNFSAENSTSGLSKQKVTEVVADPHSVESNLPPTLTVSTGALLELHAMRKSAVDLCLQLPTKYRTRLPECAEIFKHEIRLQGLAKKNN